MDFKDSLKKIRQEKQLSQQKLAEMIDVKQYVIAGWETGRSEPSIKDIIKLKSSLNVSIEYLLGLESNLELSKLNEKLNELDLEKQTKLIEIINSIIDLQK